jgi:uncharacterized protein
MLRPIHFEIHADNPERAVKFYTDVFGWKFERWGEMEYWMLSTGAKDQPGIDGGLMKRKGPKPVDGQAVNAYPCTMDVPSVDGYLKKIIAAGGSQAVPKMPIPGMAWLAYCKDTEGNLFGIFEADPNAK